MVKRQSFNKVVAQQFVKFGAIGSIALVLDIGLFNAFVVLAKIDPFLAKIISMTSAVIFAYLGNKFWSFKSTHNITFNNVFDKKFIQLHWKEFALFVLVNLVALSFSLLALYISRDVLGYTTVLADNISANVIGLALGTAFRFGAYRWFVFQPKTYAKCSGQKIQTVTATLPKNPNL